MSRAHTRLLREVNRTLADARHYRGFVEAEDYDVPYDDDHYDDGYQDCMVCGSDLGCGGFHEYCSSCGMPGCDSCLNRGDDCFPWMCSTCLGEEDDAEFDLQPVEAEFGP